MTGHARLQGWAERYTRFIEDAVVVAEVLIAGIMLILIILGVAYLVVSLVASFGEGFVFDHDRLIKLLDIALIVFIIIELFRITLAYITGERVMPTVIEAAFVAVGRKIVLYEFKSDGLYGALSLAALLAVVAAAHYLTREKPT
ncbi:MAG: phosphate-starvation-inducible PsiE family protein [Actinomycetota bacterium]